MKTNGKIGAAFLAEGVLIPIELYLSGQGTARAEKRVSFGEGSVRQQCKHKGLCGRTFLVENIMVEIPYEAVERKS